MTLTQLIATLRDKWDLGAPSSAEERATARETVKNLPVELEEFYANADSAEIGGVSFFDVADELLDVNANRTRAMRPYVYFASDGGDGFFAIDTVGKSKKGVGAVFWIDRSSPRTRAFIFCAPSFKDFLTAIAAGSTPWKGPSIEAIDNARMAAELKAHPERWSGGGPLQLGDTYDAEERVGVGFPEALNALLRLGDGVRIPGVGVTLFDRDSIEAVSGAIVDGVPGALWIGSDADGTRYAVTVIGWRGSEGGEVVRVGPGESAETAPIIGQLAAVVVAWLEGKRP